MMEMNKYLLLLTIPFIVTFIYQLKISKISNSESCLAAFKNNVKVFVGTCYSLCVLFILILGILIQMDKYLLLLSTFFILSLIYQVKFFRVNDPKSCLFCFKMNNLTGLLIFIFIFSFNF